MNARTNANLFNMSYFGKYYLTGRDSTEAAEWIFSNHMDKEPGRRSLVLTPELLSKYSVNRWERLSIFQGSFLIIIIIRNSIV